MRLPVFDFAAPRDLGEACALLAQASGEARLLAGGTDLLVKLKRGELRPRLLISLGQLRELVEVSTGDGIDLGPLATMRALAGHPALAGVARALAEGAAVVGGPLIRNRATVGGNVVNARPCADTVPPLIVLGAELTLTSVRGERTVPLDGFISGPGVCGIAPDELLTRIHLPPRGERWGSGYLKITRRAAMEVTIVGCAASLALEGGKIARPRIVLTSVAPVPLRALTAEATLEGQPPTPELIAAAGAAARRQARPIDDHRAPALFRSEMIEVTTRRALERALARAGGASEEVAR